MAGQLVLVGEQIMTAIRTLHLLLGTLGKGSGSPTCHVVINRYNPGVEGLSARELEMVLGIPTIRTVPDDHAKVLAAANAGKPLRRADPDSPVLAAIDSLVDGLLNPMTPVAPGHRSLLNRLLHPCTE